MTTTSASAVLVCDHVLGGAIPDEDGPGTDFFIGDLGFPTASGGQIGQSFPTGPRLGLVTQLFSFWGFGYNYDQARLPEPDLGHGAAQRSG